MKRVLLAMTIGLMSASLALAGHGHGGGHAAAPAASGATGHGPAGSAAPVGGWTYYRGTPSYGRGYYLPNTASGRTLNYPGVRNSTVHSTNHSTVNHTNRATTTRHPANASATGSTNRAANKQASHSTGTHHKGNAHREAATQGAGTGRGQQAGSEASKNNQSGSRLAHGTPHRRTNHGKPLDSASADKLRHWNGKRDSVAQARQKHDDHRHHHHDKDWWKHHCVVIIWSDWFWWGWNDGWWYPAWGYDPYYYGYGDYGEPVYGYENLTPEEIVSDVQSALQQEGYFSWAVDGSLGPLTKAAITKYQSDHRLPVTGTIDPATLGSLGLIRQ